MTRVDIPALSDLGSAVPVALAVQSPEGTAITESCCVLVDRDLVVQR